MRKAMSLILVLLIATLLFTACKKDTMANINLEYSKNEITHKYHFAQAEKRPFVKLSQSQKNEMLRFIEQISVNYTEADLYQTEECFNRLNTEIAVEKHQYSALDENGDLTANHLKEIININNEKYLAKQKTSMLQKPDETYLANLTELIVDVVKDMKSIYPNVDYDRVYCNLGNLKVINKNSMMSIAEVTNEMVLHISKGSSDIKKLHSGENGYRDTMVHEIMHIIQYGCVCEPDEDCIMRVGLARSYDDFDVNTSKLEWLFEGSAELLKNNLLGIDKDIYQNMVNYINTINLSTMFNDDVPARYTETLCLYDDINKLYDLFGCKNQKDKIEVLNMLITLNVIQYAPSQIMSLYGEKHGVDVKDSKVIDDINYSIKPSACMTLTKSFYKSIIELLAEEENVTLDDFCFMVSLYETAMNYHLRLNKESLTEYNAEYLTNYKLLRDELFNTLSQNMGTDIRSYFESYRITNADKENNELSASMKWNELKKNEFLLERVEFFGDEIDTKIN